MMNLKSQQAAASPLEPDARPFEAALKEGFAIGIEMRQLMRPLTNHNVIKVAQTSTSHVC